MAVRSMASVSVAATAVHKLEPDVIPARPSAIRAISPSRVAREMRNRGMAEAHYGWRVGTIGSPIESSQLGVAGAGRARMDVPLEQAATQALLERGPARVAAGIVAELAAE